MKKKILNVAVIVICLAILSTGTIAYFTAEDTAKNVITSGGIGVEIVEQQMVDGELQPYPTQPVEIMPATVVSKIVTVKSTEQPAWIRANFAVTVYDVNGEKMDVSAEELAEVIIIEPDGESWTYSDGWWYYNASVKDGEATTPLFEEVRFAGEEMGNEYQNCTVEIAVNAQGVQKANNGDTALEAIGWSEN